jgi:hypothetical protein
LQNSEQFRWNIKPEPRTFWDPYANNGEGAEYESHTTPKDLINAPNLAKFEDVLRALCEVVSELVEIHERTITGTDQKRTD